MIKNLVISGGSTKTIAVLGALKYLEEQHLLHEVKNFVGTSAGSLLCLFMVLGYKIDEIVHLLREHLFGNHLHLLELDEVMNLEFLQNYGLDSGKNIVQFFCDVLFLKCHKTDMTFVELAKLTGRNLVVCGANITKQRSDHFSVDTHPDMSIITALRISVSLPFIFTPVVFDDCYYLDGGLYEALPLTYIARFKDPVKDTLALNITSSTDPTSNRIASLLDYIRVVFTSVVDKANQSACAPSPKIRVIDIEFEDLELASFSFEDCGFVLDEPTIKKHLEKGYATIKRCFER